MKKQEIIKRLKDTVEYIDTFYDDIDDIKDVKIYIDKGYMYYCDDFLTDVIIGE